ncbi:MAG TPA: hypothetical protein DCK99_07850, partial [Blastocatellia bacterium]|nr:hypothetical protein [Blastocatellia bacterium]
PLPARNIRPHPDMGEGREALFSDNRYEAQKSNRRLTRKEAAMRPPKKAGLRSFSLEFFPQEL